jgi:hypothetical protein
LPLTLYVQPSFQRSLKRLGPEPQRTVGRILEALQAYYAGGCDLAAAQQRAARFFYKQLRKPYHEAGVDRKLRVIIRREGDKGIAMLAGNHDQIRQFLADA